MAAGEWGGRTVIVTGAASGIGRATAQRILEAGGHVVAVDLDEGGLGWTADAPRAEPLVGDVTSQETNARAVELATRTGQLNAVVLNAGVVAVGGLESLDLASFDRVVDVNLRAVVLGVRAALPALRAATAPAIVVTASVSGLGGEPGLWAYNSAKGGVVNFVRAAAMELAKEGIRINAVCPSVVHSGMTAGAPPAVYEELRRHIPLGRWGEPEEVAAVITFLASPLASFVHGALVPVDGGVLAGTGQFTPWPRD